MSYKINPVTPDIKIKSIATYTKKNENKTNLNSFDEYQEIDYSEIPIYMKKQSLNREEYIEIENKQLERIKQLAALDNQINTSGEFSKFTDFQNIMLSDLSLLELVYEGEEKNINNKTIGQLYIESISKNNNDNIEYDKIILDENQMLEMSKKENWNDYRNIILGKLVRYGFSELKIIEKVKGTDGFDAFILEDKNGDKMVYFPCTNLSEYEDYIYDIYPIMSNINGVTNLLGKTFCEKTYNSQQNQAKKLLEKVIKESNQNTKINLSGFSLGGSLAECAYLNSYKNDSESLGNIVLYNPYHNVLTEEESNILKQDNKMKLYVCEGDTVSGVFNYNEFSNIAKPIYIDYEKNISNTHNAINNNQGIINKITNSFKNEYLDYLIDKCNDAKEKVSNNIFLNPIEFTLNETIKNIQKLKELEIPLSEIMRTTSNIIEKIPGINLLEEKTDFATFFLNANYVESILTSTHLTYAVDSKKYISFDANGTVKTKIEVNNKIHEVKYPSFSETNSSFLGNIINILKTNK